MIPTVLIAMGMRAVFKGSIKRSWFGQNHEFKFPGEGGAWGYSLALLLWLWLYLDGYFEWEC